jgi:26S proteasome regulatory subunit N5
LKLKYYELMIKLDSNDNNYFNICKHFIQIYETPRISENKELMKEALKNICIYLLLSPFEFDQQQTLLRFNKDKNLDDLDKYKQLLVLFKTNEIINWKMLVLHFEKDLKVGDSSMIATEIFTEKEKGEKRWNDFKSRIVEHVISLFFFFFVKFFNFYFIL